MGYIGMGLYTAAFDRYNVFNAPARFVHRHVSELESGRSVWHEYYYFSPFLLFSTFFLFLISSQGATKRFALETGHVK